MSLRPSEDRIRDALAQVDAPDEVRERSWSAIDEAFRSREPVVHHRRWPVVAAALAIVSGGVAVAPPGRAIASWVRRSFSSAPKPGPAPLVVPGVGRLLIATGDGIWSLRAGHGGGRLLGRYAEASWSPRCLNVLVTDGRTLSAIDPDTGLTHWNARGGVVHTLAWAPNRYRVSYLVGSDLRVATGDGTTDSLLARNVVGIPAWRPAAGGPGNVLAFTTAAGFLETLDVDTRQAVLPRERVDAPGQTAWSADGGRRFFLGDQTVEVFDATGRRRIATRLAGARRPVEILAAPAGTNLLVASADGSLRVIDADTGAVQLLGRFGPSPIQAVWSPDGNRVLVAEPTNDELQIVTLGGRVGRIRITGVSERLAGAGTPSPLTQRPIQGWCG